MSKRTYEPDTTGDGGLFAAIGGGFCCFLLLLGVVAVTGAWFGPGAQATVLEIGLVVVALATIALYVATNRGQR